MACFESKFERFKGSLYEARWHEVHLQFDVGACDFVIVVSRLARGINIEFSRGNTERPHVGHNPPDVAPQLHFSSGSFIREELDAIAECTCKQLGCSEIHRRG